MNKKAIILLLSGALALGGAVIKGTQNANANLPETPRINANHPSIILQSNRSSIIAQSGDSPWNQRISPKTYTNPDTGQDLCFYYASSRWAPCPGQGDVIIRPQNAKCRGQGNGWSRPKCPKDLCLINSTPYFPQPGEAQPPPSLPCTGLP